MKKFDVTIQFQFQNATSEYGVGTQINYYDTISAKEVPSRIVFSILYFIFKLTEAYVKE